MIWGTFFSHVARGCKGLPGWSGALFFHICLFDRGGGALKLFGQWLYRTNTFKKGTSLSADHFLNLVLFIPSALEYCLDVEKLNLSAIRTVRVLRPLRAINRIPSGFILKQIRDIRIITFFYQKAWGSWWCCFWTPCPCSATCSSSASLSSSYLASLEFNSGQVAYSSQAFHPSSH